MRYYTLAMVALALLLAVFLGACSTTPISGSLPRDAATGASRLLGRDGDGGPLRGTIEQGLKDASFNLDEAVRVGALPKNDPAPACLHTVLADIGLEGEPQVAESYTPKISDLISFGAVAYIRARQAAALARGGVGGGLELSLECKALVGQIAIDAGRAAARLGKNFIPGGGLLNMILGTAPIPLPAGAPVAQPPLPRPPRVAQQVASLPRRRQL